MISVVSILVQLVGFIAGIYLIFAEGFWIGVGLIAVVAALHVASSQLSNGLLYLHQKTMRDDELEGLALAVRVYGNEGAPRAWHIIGNSCAVLFWVSASAAIYWFVTNNW